MERSVFPITVYRISVRLGFGPVPRRAEAQTASVSPAFCSLQFTACSRQIVQCKCFCVTQGPGVRQKPRGKLSKLDQAVQQQVGGVGDRQIVSCLSQVLFRWRLLRLLDCALPVLRLTRQALLDPVTRWVPACLNRMLLQPKYPCAHAERRCASYTNRHCCSRRSSTDSCSSKRSIRGGRSWLAARKAQRRRGTPAGSLSSTMMTGRA
jgi:hypothetical protein